MRRPPRLAEWLLSRLLPELDRETILGDLEEEYRDVAQARPRSARAWYWLQATTLGGRFTIQRLRARMRRRGDSQRRRAAGSSRGDRMIGDVKYALRSLLRQRGLAAAAVVTVAVGVGATAAIFSVVHSVLLEPLPYEKPERLALVWGAMEEAPYGQNWLSGPEIEFIREHASSIEKVAALWPETYTLTGGGPPEQLRGGDVSGVLFSMLGRGAVVGRTLRPEDSGPGAEPVVVLSDEFWRRRYGADPATLGATIRLDDESYRVVGIMPPGFQLLTPEEGLFHQRPDIWVPLKLEDWPNAGNHSLVGLARLDDDVEWSVAREELAALGARYGAERGAHGFRFVPVGLLDDVVDEIRPALVVLMGGVLLVLAIVCVNVANMLLVRARTRRSELAVRSALGAGRGRIARQLLLESLLLALTGGAAGLALGLLGMKLLIALAPANLPRVAEAELNLPVLLFALGVTGSVGVLFGLAPVREAARLRLAETLKEGGPRSVGPGSAGRLQSGLVVAQFALAFMLLIAAGLMLRSLLALQRVDPGFDPRGVLTAQVSLPQSGYPDEAARRAFLLPVLERLRVQSGVEAVGAISELPYSEDFRGGTALLYGDAPDGRQMVEVEADLRSVTDGFFAAMGAEVTAGRSFDARDVEEVPQVVVIDRVFAEKYWPGETPVGRRIDFGSDWTNPREIIGIVEHIQHYGPGGPRRPQVYFSYRQRATPTMSLTVRVSGDPLAATEMVGRAVLEGDPNQPITRVVPMQALVESATAADRFYLRLLATFAAIALVLAALGIYALIAHSVTARLKEIGVRMALGAGPGSVQWLFVRRALRLSLLGAVIGGAGALAAARFVAGLVHGVSPRDPATMVMVLATLTAAAVLAGYLPARAAAAESPARALRDR